MKVTIRTVANRAGVSPATVSRVLNDPVKVGAETRRKVQQAMAELDFQPSAIARGLSVQHMDTIGLLVPGINGLFFNELYQGIDEVAWEHGMKVLLFDAQLDHHRALDGFTFLKQHRVAGIIFTSGSITDDYQAMIDRLGIPVVLALTHSRMRPLSAFRTDDVKAAFDATAYLIARGHSRIAMVAGPPENDVAGSTRLEGYRQALAHYGAEYSDELVDFGDFHFHEGYRAMDRILRRVGREGFTAVFAASDEMALGAIRCLAEHGLRVPDDVSVMGYDNLYVAEMTTPGLTTVAQPFQQIGRLAVECLLQAIGAGETEACGGIHLLPHQIIERDTVKTVSR
ncbi:LacI family DNA-binding transcriptional regulator [Alicyclobacillus shizuokensis]|uniref:LacI family DNA-binding transcriptional regulator n=1 Tax=Alicyclobacillus shizuokensis TaxID=392014 RepID=UPI00082DA3E0|nr:LacI family DNA-binding transcriptional regulator [Alicyclobacillus shizuokensis]MCL6626200.1 LacI family transcriptional regulator [Alicyclobacillus shizuokensis]